MFKIFAFNPLTRQIVSLAWPLVLTQVGHIVTGMVDTIFLGQLGVTEQAAGILSNNLYVVLLVFLIGMSYASTPLVAAANEQKNKMKIALLFKNSLFLNFIVATICFVILFFASPLLHHMQQPEEVVTLAKPFFNVLIFSMIPLSLFFTCKQFCEGIGNTKLALIISITGNLLNILLNYALIYGELGFPEMGYIGSAWASFIARMFMGISFLILVFYHPFTYEIKIIFNKIMPNWIEIKELWKIGFNSALQFTFEVAAFAIAGFMSGSFGKEQIDSHGIALNMAAFTYMFGSGIGNSASIVCGTLMSQGNWKEIKKVTIVSVKLIFVVMGFFALMFLCFNTLLAQTFSGDKQIIELTSKLLIIAALFQLFDGLQVTFIGILRGLQDVTIPTYITLIGYWFVAIPLSYILAFSFNLKTIGIWIALLISLLLVGIASFIRLRHLIRKNLYKI